VLALAAGAFAWDWDGVSAVATVVLALGVGFSVVTFAYQRRRDRQLDMDEREKDRAAQADQRERDRLAGERAIQLQADAARRDLATKIMIDAFQVLIDSPQSRDDTFLEKISNPLSMLQLVMNDEQIGQIRELITAQQQSLKTKESVDMGPVLRSLRDCIRGNLGIDETHQQFEYLRIWNPRTRNLPVLGALWQVLMAELMDGAQPSSHQQLWKSVRQVELLGERGERKIVAAILREWESADRSRREQLADELGGWIRETQQIIDGNGHGVWAGHLGDEDGDVVIEP